MGAIKIKNTGDLPIEATVGNKRIFIPVGETGVVDEDIFQVLQESVYQDKFELVTKLATKTEPIIEGEVPVAFVSEFASNYSGGRYHTLEVACAMCEAGMDVHLYCNREPPFIEDFEGYRLPKIHVTNIQDLDVRASFYIGSPVHGSIIACNLAKKYGRPVYSLVFDSLPLMQVYKPEALDATEEYWEEFVEAIKTSNAILLANSKVTAESVKGWLKVNKVKVFYPTVNNRVLSQVQPQLRYNYIVFVSRIVKHKNIEHMIGAIKDLEDWSLHIVTDTGSNTLKELVEKNELEQRVKIYRGINDNEKFKLFKRAKIMLNASTFEGAGMWAQEAEACGLKLVCYALPTIGEMYKGPNVFKARVGDKDDLKDKLLQAVASRETPYESTDFYLDNYAVNRARELFKEPVEIGVMMIALNEHKFIEPALRALLASPHIKKIAVVEGAVELYAHAATGEGLSKDNTSTIIRRVMAKYDKDGKIIYDRYGWARDKSELRNRCIELLGTKVNWLLKVDGDEVYKEKDLDKLAKIMQSDLNITTIYMKHLHFWKKKSLVAVGGQWDNRLPRCFRFRDKTLRFREHNLPPYNSAGKNIEELGKRIETDEVKIYHYGYMKDVEDVRAKLEFYKKRDKHLKVIDTFSNWKEGLPTQPTHGGGTVEKFTGKHPSVMRGVI